MGKLSRGICSTTGCANLNRAGYRHALDVRRIKIVIPIAWRCRWFRVLSFCHKIDRPRTAADVDDGRPENAHKRGNRRTTARADVMTIHRKLAVGWEALCREKW